MAVPTVLGIASIRVYTVSEAPAPGLVSREKVRPSLNTLPLHPAFAMQRTLFTSHQLCALCVLCLCVQLNVYTPVLRSAGGDEFVPEQPGLIQKGMTAARETIQPYVRAAQVLVLL